MLECYEAVIFDMDGTLIDSMWMWKDIDKEYLGKFGISVPEGLDKEIEGMSFSETAVYFKERFQIPDELAVIKEEWNHMAWDKYKNEVPLKQGVRKLLSYLKENHIKAGIGTSNSRELAELILEKHGIQKYFQAVHTSCEVPKGKPAPDIYLLTAKNLAVSPEKCLVFEDVLQGIFAGKNAGMKVCAIEDEYSIKETEQKKRYADYYIKNFDELFSLNE